MGKNGEEWHDNEEGDKELHSELNTLPHAQLLHPKSNTLFLRVSQVFESALDSSDDDVSRNEHQGAVDLREVVVLKRLFRVHRHVQELDVEVGLAILLADDFARQGRHHLQEARVAVLHQVLLVLC